MKKNGPQKHCRVCGGIAQSFNFNGLACESCKEFVCFNRDRCEVNVLNRRFCKKCRLNKCFAIGMRKELIKSAAELEKSNSSEITLAPYESACMFTITNIATIFQDIQMKDIQIVGCATDLLQVFNMQEFFIQSVIKMADSVDGFTTISHADKLTILQEAFPKIMLLRSAFFFNFEKNAFYVRINPESTMAIMVSLEMFYGPKLSFFTKMHRELALLIYELAERDTTIRDFIAILILFQTSNHTSSREFLRYNFTKYSFLLKKYLNVKYQSTVKGEQQFEKLMHIIEEVGPLKKLIVEIFSNIDFNLGPVSKAMATMYEFHSK